MAIKWSKRLILALSFLTASNGWCADFHGRSSTQFLWFNNDFNDQRQIELAEYLRFHHQHRQGREIFESTATAEDLRTSQQRGRAEWQALLPVWRLSGPV